jgi:hypothetical protein
MTSRGKDRDREEGGATSRFPHFILDLFSHLILDDILISYFRTALPVISV